MEFNETFELGLNHPILSNHISKNKAEILVLGASPANCTQNTNMDLGLSLMLTALCRATSCPTCVSNVDRLGYR